MEEVVQRSVVHFKSSGGYLKFLPIQQYLKLLESNDITPSKFTLQEKKKNEEDPKKNQATAKDSSTKTSTTWGSTQSTERLDDDSSELTPPDSDDEGRAPPNSKHLKPPAVVGFLPPKKAPSLPPPTQPVVPTQALSKPPPPTFPQVDTPVACKLFKQAPAKMEGLEKQLAGLKVDEGTPQTPRGTHLRGTLKDPFVIYANLNFPERNREFEIFKVDGVKSNDHKWNSIYIHKAISPGSTDYQQWAARILDDTEFPQYPGPKILIKGNSRDFWVRNLGRYHDNPNGPNCVATKLKHREAYFAIIEDPERQCTYWIIVLPQHIELDNSVLAGDDKEVPTEMLPIRIVHADIDQTKKRREALRANNVEKDEDEDEDTDLPDGMLGMVLF